MDSSQSVAVRLVQEGAARGGQAAKDPMNTPVPTWTPVPAPTPTEPVPAYSYANSETPTYGHVYPGTHANSDADT